MYWITELYIALRDFMESGGPVLWWIAILVTFMWALIFERVYYFLYGHDEVTSDIQNKFSSMKFKSRWHENQIKARFVSEGRTAINRNVQLIQICIALCPLFGLMGTVTGMIEVFQVMAFTGGGDARSMAGGVSKATLPTMAGMVSALSGVLAMIWIKNKVETEELLIGEYVSAKKGE
jgi:biopolymer transport protein ExbB